MKTKRAKFRLWGLIFVGLTFVLLVALVGVAVVNYIIADAQYDWYTATLVAISVLTLAFSITLCWILFSASKKSEILIDGIERVTSGDFTHEIEIKRGDTFAEVYFNFNRMMHELGAVRSMREEFVHTLSHEFKTPLASIRGFADLLAEGGVTEEERQKFLKIISDEADRLCSLAENVLTISKLENQQMQGGRTRFRLDAQLRECVIIMENEWERKDIEIVTDLQDIEMTGDESMLRRVWINLLSNAVKFTPEGGRVELSLKREGGNAVVRVKDSGCGISPRDMPRIFDKYYRAESAKKTEGNGLGLSICKYICKLFDGGIEAENTEGGACFKVWLPVTRTF